MAKKGSIFSSWFGKKKKQETKVDDRLPESSQSTSPEPTSPEPNPPEPSPPEPVSEPKSGLTEATASEVTAGDVESANAESSAKPFNAVSESLAAPEPTSQPTPASLSEPALVETATSETTNPAGMDEQPLSESVQDEPSAVAESAVAKTMESASASVSSQTSEAPVDASATAVEPVQPLSKEASKTAQRPGKKGLWARLRDGLKKTSSNIGEGLANLFVGKEIDDELFEDLETQLLMADVGVETTQKIIKELTAHASRRDLKDAERLYERLKEYLGEILEPVSQPLQIQSSDGPMVILMVGVNGVGKTTTIGKLAQQFQRDGKSVMLAAGDTFRAAAVEQLQVWGERNDISVIAQHTGADSASVIFDALSAAKARGVDVLIADTAGRLQNKANLMEELKKIVRVMKKVDPNAPHEILLTLDAGTGQNAISQANLFNQAVGVTGLVMTKLDGTAKGGVIFALADQFKIPIRYIGVGEQLDDLRNFDAKEFIQALFEQK